MKSSLSRRVKNVLKQSIELLEPRRLFSITSVSTIPTQEVDPSVGATITLSSFIGDPQITGGTLIEMQTPEGNIPFQLTDSKTPLTVANFETYINNMDYQPTVVSRASPGFVIQGGGTKPDGSNITAVGTTNSSGGTVTGEPGISNTVGTIAMALSNGPNSGTNQWFINLGNNSVLDGTSDGGPFTVFGNVIDKGLSVANTIAGLPTLDAHTENPQWGLGSSLGNLPVNGYTGASPLPSGSTVPQANLVTDNIVQIPAAQAVTYTATSAAPSIVTASISNGVLSLAAAPGVTSGQTTVTVTGTDLSNQSVSQTVTVNLASTTSVAVTLGAGGAKSVNYLDTDGTNAVVSLRGPGSASVQFTGTGLNPVTTRQNTVILSSTTASISGITLTNTTAASSLTITTTGGTRNISVGAISSATIGTINARGVTLTGDVNVSGNINTLTIAAAQGGTINATTIGTLTTSGTFSDGLTLFGTKVSLNRFTAGAISGGAWNISLTANSITAKTISGWNATFTAVNNLTVKGDLGGTISATAIKNLNVTGTLMANINAASISSLSVHGGITSSTIATTAAGIDLARVNVSGAITNSTFNATGNIGSVMAEELVGSFIYAGVGNLVTGQVLPNFNTDFTTNSSIAMVKLRTIPNGDSFSNSDIAAESIGKLYLGTILTSNGGQATGVAAHTIALLNAIAGGKKVALKGLTSASNVQTILSGEGIDLADFVVKLF